MTIGYLSIRADGTPSAPLAAKVPGTVNVRMAALW